jgi:hypothetical protein
MMRIIFSDLRDAKYMVALIVGLVVVMMTVMNLMLPSSPGGMSLGVGSIFLAYAPLLLLQKNSQQRNRTNRIATLASLPIAAHILSLSRYGAAISVQIGLAAIFLSIGAVTHINSSDVSESVLFGLNCAFLGLGLMAIGLLIIDLFPRSAPTVGGTMWLSIMFLMRTKIFDWSWIRLGDVQSFMSVAAIVLVIIGTEVYVFCRRSSLV